MAVDLTSLGVNVGKKGILGAISEFNLLYIAVPVLILIAFGGLIAYLIYRFKIYKYKVWLFEDQGLETIIFQDRGRLIKDGNNRFIFLFNTKQKATFPEFVLHVGRSKILPLARTTAGDIQPIKYFGKTPSVEWFKENNVITQDEEGGLNFDTTKLFPMLRPDNLKVRHQHTLLQRESITRFTKKKLWQELLPYFASLGTAVVCLMMIIITMHTIGKLG